MKKWKHFLMFAVGGTGYLGLELLWRGWTHYSMFIAGGSCFLLLGKLQNTKPTLPLPLRGLVGAGIITCIELAAGLAVNTNYTVWDYRTAPFNFHGQICLPFSLLWIPVSLGAMELYARLDSRLGTAKA